MKRHRIPYAAAAAATAALLSPAALAQQGYPGGHEHMMWGGSWGPWIGGPFTMLLLLALLIAGLVALVRWLGAGDRRGPSDDRASARAILEERFARGEIDESEFNERKRTLES